MLISICQCQQSESTSTTKKRRRSRRPTKARIRVEVIPPVNCNDLQEYSLDNGDDLIRKTQHIDSCQKYFECVQNHWVDRDCPQGTTFNNQLKQCDSEKTCRPSRVSELYADGILELKRALGLEPTPDIWALKNQRFGMKMIRKNKCELFGSNIWEIFHILQWWINKIFSYQSESDFINWIFTQMQSFAENHLITVNNLIKKAKLSGFRITSLLVLFYQTDNI